MNWGTILFLCFLPAFIALGHDITLFILAQETLDPSLGTLHDMVNEESPPKRFSFASLGYILTQYLPGVYAVLPDYLSERDWAMLRSILPWKAFFIGMGFGLIATTITAILKLTRYIKDRKKRVKRKL